ncbi:Ig-like domain-containing protein [Janthinobacterium aquaticum]|uniref:Ig-like domain-containing protein n=1 Tax=Janthinobacterium sp. FT58W TaxID=2654254 RepID=UPI00186B186E|nr:Ig-like domain-containing protein [Janthinobacterium sp. FT58W]
MLGRAYQWLALLVVGTLLAACGGGGGDPTIGGGSGSGNGGTPAVATTLKLSLLGASGQSSNALSTTAPLTAQALVLDAAGMPVSNMLVAFTSDATLVTLSPTNGSALTDAKGIASVTLSPFNATVSGAGKLTASVTPATTGATPIIGEANYVVTAAQPAGARIALSLLNGASASNALSNATPLTAKAVVTDLGGKPISGALVLFSTDSKLAALSSSTGTALTDASGTASLRVTPVSLQASGAGSLQVSTTANGATASDQVNYTLKATELYARNLSFLPDTIAAFDSTTMTVDIIADDGTLEGVPYNGSGVSVRFSSPCIQSGKASVGGDVVAVNGKATVVYRDLGCRTEMIMASVVGSDGAAHSMLTIAPQMAASIQLIDVTPANKSIVIKGQGGLLRTETATLKYRVYDTANRPLAGQEVLFSVDDGSPVTLNKVSAFSDVNGEVMTTVNSGNQPTTFRVKAWLKSNLMYSYSDSMLVTTGSPVQSGFSLSVDKANVEGWQYDSGTNSPAATVFVLLADQAGNPVPDGTPVAFQTNLGSVGSSNMGGCITANGGCSVDFRSQNPRTASNPPVTPCNDISKGGVPDSTQPGLASICASTSDGSKTLFRKTTIFLSGSRAENVIINDTNNQGSFSAKLTGAQYNLGTTANSAQRKFSLKISDLHENPMPYGTTVTITDAVNATGSVVPATINNVYAHNAQGVDDRTGANLEGNQGSFHAVTINSLTPNTCTTSVSSTFNVTVTTPIGNITSFPFKLVFSCP